MPFCNDEVMLHLIHGSITQNVGTLALFCGDCKKRFVCRRSDEPDKQRVVCPNQCAQDTLANVLKSRKAPPTDNRELEKMPPRTTKYADIDVVEYFPNTGPSSIEISSQRTGWRSTLAVTDKAAIKTQLQAGIKALAAMGEFPTCIRAGTVAFDRIAAL